MACNWLPLNRFLFADTSSCIAAKALLTAESRWSRESCRRMLAFSRSGSRNTRDSPVSDVRPVDSTSNAAVARNINYYKVQ